MRDLILKRTPKDIDMVTSAELHEVCHGLSLLSISAPLFGFIPLSVKVIMPRLWR